MDDRALAQLSVTELARFHKLMWRDESESYWLSQLIEEVAELAAALLGKHDDPPEWELMQIASIAINWLARRKAGETCQNLLADYGITEELRRLDLMMADIKERYKDG